MRSLLIVLSLFASSVLSQDPEKRINVLIEIRAQRIAKVDQEFQSEIAKLRDSQVQEIEEQRNAAMKSLDLQKSNKLNELLQKWKLFSPAIRRRMVFVIVPDNKDTISRFFSRGPEDIWLECTSDKLFRHKETKVTPEYIECTHESGNVHRLYETKNMYRSAEKKDFVLVSRGYWLGDLDVDIPSMK